MARFLGVDVGTTLCTAVVVDDHGTVLASRSAAIPTQRPASGRVEQDPQDLLAAFDAAVDPLVASHKPDAVGVANQGESFVLWDRFTGLPLTPNIVWEDQRGAAVCEALSKKLPSPTWLTEKTGLRLDSYFSAPKLAAVFQAQPQLFDAARAGRLLFGTVETWVLWKRSGGRLHVTDPSTASRTLLFNIHDLRWDPELLALFDIPEAILPEVRPAAGFLGAVTPGLPIHALVVDQQAALFGQACFVAGQGKCTFGTGSFLLVNTGATPLASSQGLLTTVAWQLHGATSYALDGGVFCVGSAMQWLTQHLGVLDNVESSSAVAQANEDHDVMVVPALSGLAAPRWLTHVRGAVFGLTHASTGASLVRGTLDGIACQVFEVARAMEQDLGGPLGSFKVDGGPSRNAYLMQTLADLLQTPVLVAAQQESTALGAANLARHALTGIALPDLAAQWRASKTYQPQPGSRREVLLQRWGRAVAALAGYHAAP